MPAYPFNPSTFHYTGPNGISGTFRPTGKLVQHGPYRNPEEWDLDETISARLPVGFNVGDIPTHDMASLIALVKRVRKGQGEKADASFVAQTGIYTHRDPSQGEVTENGAQALIVNLSGATMAHFRKQMVALAETICRDFDQETVIVEVQVNGLTKHTIGVIA